MRALVYSQGAGLLAGRWFTRRALVYSQGPDVFTPVPAAAASHELP